MKHLLIILSISFLFLNDSFAQFGFVNKNEIPVIKSGDTLINAWGGGINYGQVSEIDFDFDGDMDLFVFDRSSNNVLLFEQVQGWNGPYYRSVYKAEEHFPNDLRYRAAMIDYDLDGKNDLFSYGIGGISVYRNTGDAINGLQWTLVKDLLYSQYSSTYTNLYVSSGDIPAIVDVDFDSDIDILTFDISGRHVEYHQNQSMELYGIPDSLIFEQKNECWGLFSEDITTNSVLLNDPNPPCIGGNIPNPLKNKPQPQLGGFKHSGSTVLALDYNNSGVMDLVLGDVAYPNLTLLINGGSAPNTNSPMISDDPNFPSNTTPAHMELFPASFYVDVDFDQIKDLVVCSNAKNVSENETSVHFFKNIGSNSNPNFIFQHKNHLQNEMIEHGTASIPILFDYNEDGKRDLLVGNFFRFLPGLNKESTVALYLNTGNQSSPVYSYVDYDIFNFGSQSYGLRTVPTFGDIDNDGDEDMFLGLENGSITYVENQSTGSGAIFTTGINNYTDNNGVPIGLTTYSYPQLFDLDKDDLLDLLIGNKDGSIAFYKNVGTLSNPSFQLVDSTLGQVNVATLTPDGLATPHFFRHNDTTFLFVGSDLGKMWYYDSIDGNLGVNDTFNLVSSNYLDLNTGRYSAYWVEDIDGNGNLDLLSGHDLGGILHFESDPGSTIGLKENVLQTNLILYPNPNRGSFNIECDLPITQIMIRDQFGRLVLEEQLHSKEAKIEAIFANGIYFVEVITALGEHVIKRMVIN